MTIEPGTVVEEKVGLLESDDEVLIGLRIVVPAGTKNVGAYIREKIRSKDLEPLDGKITKMAMCQDTLHTLVIWRIN